MNIIFFGSSLDSVIVLEKIIIYGVCAVVTQPAKPIGRKQILTPTPIETWAKEHAIPVLSFYSLEEYPSLYANEQTVIDTLEPFKAELLVSASYGQKIPTKTISDAKLGGLNIHPSILPRWRGADPVPWAILSGDHQTGVTVVTLSEKFDQGKIIAQKKIPITDKDTSDPLRTKLFEIGADLLVDILTKKSVALQGEVLQGATTTPYARKFTRDDGFEPWEKIMDPKESKRINRKFRALHPWPGLWTLFNNKRLKILEFTHIPTLVQLESKKPVSWELFQTAYFIN